MPNPKKAERKWNEFLENLTQPHVALTERHARYVRQVWKELEAIVGPQLPLPSAQQSHEGAMKLCWSNTGVYAELELHPDETHEWFFKNRSTGEFHGTTEPVGDGVERRFAELVSAAVKK